MKTYSKPVKIWPLRVRLIWVMRPYNLRVSYLIFKSLLTISN